MGNADDSVTHDGTQPSANGADGDLKGDSPKEGCRYRIISHHARGGLGDIFLAEDLELGRTVALKEIRDRYALDAQARARFLLEAEVIGKLEHPGIVPIYGMGHYRDGQPFYAMRFIKGDSLREAIDRFHEGRPKRPPGEHELMFRGLLGRLVDACNAIDYAHSRGVLHRDLKPGNVMLGRFGETLVVDWGLAKVLVGDGVLDEGLNSGRDDTEGPFRSQASEGVEATRLNAAIGTPRYMSPEQAASQVDKLGPASDIFGLGATLYCLLTGRAPYLGPDRETVEELARRAEFPPPRKVRRDIPPPLESICLAAMKADPDGRYPSARALADDIERWLADEPVAVHAYSRPARLARWVRRHRPLVAAAAALLMTLSIALAVSSVIFRAKEKEAEYNFKLAGEVIDQMLVRVGDERLIYVPQMNELRSEFGDEAVRYGKKLLDQHPEDPDLRYSYANKCVRAANNHLLAGRLGRFLEYNDTIISLYQNLIADYPANLRYVNALAFAELSRGSALQKSGDIKSALAMFHSALARAEWLTREDPNSADFSVHFRTTLARSRMYLSDALMTVGEYPEAREHYDASIGQLTLLVEERPKDHFFRRSLVQSTCGRGVVAAEMGDGEKASRMFDQAMGHVDQLRERGDSPVEVDILMVYVLREKGRWLASRRGFAADAERAHDQAERLIGPHCGSHPHVHDYQIEWASALLNRGLARIELEAEKKRAAEADFERAIAILEPLAGRGSTMSRARSKQGQAKGALGRLLLARGERERGISLLKEAAALQRGCLEANRTSPIDKTALAQHEGSLREAGLDPND